MRKGLLWVLLITSGLGWNSSGAMAQLPNTQQAGIETDGNIFVSSDTGKLIWMGNTKRCEETSVTPDGQTVMCVVMETPTAENPMLAMQIEIYRRGGQKQVFRPGAPFREWHFWEDGKQVEICSGEPEVAGTHELYDVATGALVEKVVRPNDEKQLPQWAKSATQAAMESVPENGQLAQERRQWITKVLYEVNKIRPGMIRGDLLKVFTIEGGLSNRWQRTYVYAGCPYIKVDVKFRTASGAQGDVVKEELGDVIESISKPYLGWMTTD